MIWQEATIAFGQEQQAINNILNAPEWAKMGQGSPMWDTIVKFKELLFFDIALPSLWHASVGLMGGVHVSGLRYSGAKSIPHV